MICVDIQARRGNFFLQSAFESSAMVTGVFGSSGCGKTTLLHCIAGLVRPERGTMSLGGRVLFDASVGIDEAPEARRIGMVFQENRLFPHLNVRENLMFGFNRIRRGERRFSFAEIVEMLGLASILDQRADRLSGGEARRVALGRALLMSPELLVLDEPLTGIDKVLCDRILAYLLTIKNKLKLPMIYVSHSFSDLIVLADLIVAMESEAGERMVKHGKVGRAGTPVQLLTPLSNLGLVDSVEVVLGGRIERLDRDHGYGVVRTRGMSVLAPAGPELGDGSEVFVKIRSDEIIVARGEVPAMSVRNVWDGIVVSILRTNSKCLVELDLGGDRIFADLTPYALEALALAESDRVKVLCKASGLRIVSCAFAGRIIPG